MAEKKLDYEFIIEDVWAADTKVPTYNPLGKVPCLVMEGGEAIFDSRVIVEYLDTLSPVGKLIPIPGRERAEVKTWEALCDGLLDASIAARLEDNWAGRASKERSKAWIERQMSKVQACLQSISTALGDKPFCVSNHLSLADIALGCALGYLDFRFSNLDWRQSYPNLAPYFEKLSQRASFLETAHH
jgi:glutathione S-transferase